MSKIKSFIKNPYFLAFISYAALLYQLDMYDNYNGYKFIYLIAFIGLIVLFKNFKNNNSKEIKKYSTILAIILASILIIGRTVMKYEFNPRANLFTLNSIILNLTFILLAIPFFYVCFNYLILFISNIKLKDKEQFNSKKLNIISFTMIYLGKIPYLLAFFPGVMTIDSLNMINLFENGTLYNNHPIIFTYFFGFIYNIGKTLFKSGTMGICFYMLIQILIISLVLTSVISFLNKKKVNKVILIFLLLYFSFAPDFGYMSVTLWKDVLFGIAFIPLILSLINILSESKLPLYWYIIFIVSSLMILFFRNNGIYVYLFSFIFLLLLFRYKKIIPITSLVLIISYFIITGPIYNKLNVIPGRTVEAYSVLLEQVGRVYIKGGNVDKESDEYFHKLINIEDIDNKYLTWLLDPMKNLTNNDVLTNTKKDFLKYWFKTFLHNPLIYVESFLSSSVGYWYPDVVYISVRESSVNVAKQYDVTKYDIYQKSLLPNNLVNLIRKTTVKSLPLSMIIWSLGFSFLILITSFILSLYFKVDKKLLVIYAPLIALWLTNVIAAPVYCEYRYIYGLIVCNILLISFPIIYKKRERV